MSGDDESLILWDPSLSIKITGLDEAKKMLGDMVKDVEPKGFAKWADKIEKTAKEICNDPECKRITFKVEKGTTKISVSVKDKKTLECIRSMRSPVSSLQA